MAAGVMIKTIFLTSYFVMRTVLGDEGERGDVSGYFTSYIPSGDYLDAILHVKPSELLENNTNTNRSQQQFLSNQESVRYATYSNNDVIQDHLLGQNNMYSDMIQKSAKIPKSIDKIRGNLNYGKNDYKGYPNAKGVNDLSKYIYSLYKPKTVSFEGNKKNYYDNLLSGIHYISPSFSNALSRTSLSKIGDQVALTNGNEQLMTNSLLNKDIKHLKKVPLKVIGTQKINAHGENWFDQLIKEQKLLEQSKKTSSTKNNEINKFLDDYGVRQLGMELDNKIKYYNNENKLTKIEQLLSTNTNNIKEASQESKEHNDEAALLNIYTNYKLQEALKNYEGLAHLDKKRTDRGTEIKVEPINLVLKSENAYILPIDDDSDSEQKPSGNKEDINIRILSALLNANDISSCLVPSSKNISSNPITNE